MIFMRLNDTHGTWMINSTSTFRPLIHDCAATPLVHSFILRSLFSISIRIESHWWANKHLPIAFVHLFAASRRSVISLSHLIYYTMCSHSFDAHKSMCPHSRQFLVTHSIITSHRFYLINLFKMCVGVCADARCSQLTHCERYVLIIVVYCSALSFVCHQIISCFCFATYTDHNSSCFWRVRAFGSSRRSAMICCRWQQTIHLFRGRCFYLFVVLSLSFYLFREDPGIASRVFVFFVRTCVCTLEHCQKKCTIFLFIEWSEHGVFGHHSLFHQILR